MIPQEKLISLLKEGALVISDLTDRELFLLRDLSDEREIQVRLVYEEPLPKRRDNADIS